MKQPEKLSDEQISFWSMNTTDAFDFARAIEAARDKQWIDLIAEQEPVPAGHTALLRQTLEAAKRWHQGDKWRGSDKHGEWQAQIDLLNAALEALNVKGR